MPKPLTPEQITAALERGAESKVHPKLVEIANIETFAKQMHEIAQEITGAHKKSQAVILSSLQRLTEAIQEKKIDGTDMSGLIEAILAMKADTENLNVNMPLVDYEWIFERDQQGRIKSGAKLKAILSVEL